MGAEPDDGVGSENRTSEPCSSAGRQTQARSCASSQTRVICSRLDPFELQMFALIVKIRHANKSQNCEVETCIVVFVGFKHIFCLLY